MLTAPLILRFPADRLFSEIALVKTFRFPDGVECYRSAIVRVPSEGASNTRKNKKKKKEKMFKFDDDEKLNWNYENTFPAYGNKSWKSRTTHHFSLPVFDSACQHVGFCASNFSLLISHTVVKDVSRSYLGRVVTGHCTHRTCLVK